MARSATIRNVAKKLIIHYLKWNEALRFSNEEFRYWKNKKERKYEKFVNEAPLFRAMQKNLTDEADLDDFIGNSIFLDDETMEVNKEELNLITITVEAKTEEEKKLRPINIERISLSTYKNAFNELKKDELIYIDSDTKEIRYKEIKSWEQFSLYPVLRSARAIEIEQINYNKLYFFKIEDAYIDLITKWLNDVFKIEHIDAYCTKLPNVLMVISQDEDSVNQKRIIEIFEKGKFNIKK